jgi:hypothetical protein
MKGTPNHGIKSQNGRTSQVPCLNCFEVNRKFYDALKRLHNEGNQKFQLGILLNKRKLKTIYNVINVCTTPPFPRPPLKECHHYDFPQFRRGALDPFNFCDVVRVESPPTNLLNLPLARVSEDSIMGMLVRKEDYSDIENLWEWDKIKLFPVL